MPSVPRVVGALVLAFLVAVVVEVCLFFFNEYVPTWKDAHAIALGVSATAGCWACRECLRPWRGAWLAVLLLPPLLVVTFMVALSIGNTLRCCL